MTRIQTRRLIKVRIRERSKLNLAVARMERSFADLYEQFQNTTAASMPPKYYANVH